MNGKQIWATVPHSRSGYLDNLHTTVQRVSTTGRESTGGHRWRVVLPAVGYRPITCRRRYISTRRRSEHFHRTRKSRYRYPATYTAWLSLGCRFWWGIKDIFEATRFASNVIRSARATTARHGDRLVAKRWRCYYRRKCYAAWTNQRWFRVGS